MSSSALRETTRPASSDDSSPMPSYTATKPRKPVEAPAKPWYQREPWLAVTVSAFVPVAVGFALPQSVHMPLLALAGLLVIVGLGLLVRQGPTK